MPEVLVADVVRVRGGARTGVSRDVHQLVAVLEPECHVEGESRPTGGVRIQVERFRAPAPHGPGPARRGPVGLLDCGVAERRSRSWGRGVEPTPQSRSTRARTTIAVAIGSTVATHRWPEGCFGRAPGEPDLAS